MHEVLDCQRKGVERQPYFLSPALAVDSDFDSVLVLPSLLPSFFDAESLLESPLPSESDLDEDDFLAESVTYHPEPLNCTAGAEIICSTLPPQSGHLLI